MKHLLISTIGNRDVQFLIEDKDHLPDTIQHFLIKNSEAENLLVISKSKEEEWDFYKRSRKLLDYYDKVFEYIKYPLITHAMHNEGNPEKTVLIVTDQEPIFHLDTIFVGRILQSKLKRDLGTEVRLISVKDAQNAQDIFRIFQDLIQKHQKDYRITLHTSGGLPNFRMSAFMASLFQEQVKVVNYIGQDAHEASMYGDYEKHTMFHIVKNMLRNWNYSAVLALPVISEDVKKICRFAIARLALDMDKARELSSSIPLQHPIPTQEDKWSLEKELVYSAYIKYHQREYGDFLFRLFTFHDNMLVPHVEEILGGQIEFDIKSGHQSWRALLNQERNKNINEYLKNTKIGKSPLDISQPNKSVYYKILHYCKNYTDERPLTQKQFLVMNLFNKLNEITSLRNLIAHSYAGINEAMILEKANIQNIETITNKIDQYLEIKFNQVEPFKELNEMVLKKL